MLKIRTMMSFISTSIRILCYRNNLYLSYLSGCSLSLTKTDSLEQFMCTVLGVLERNKQFLEDIIDYKGN